jgi:outer membrane protein TolC
LGALALTVTLTARAVPAADAPPTVRLTLAEAIDRARAASMGLAQAEALTRAAEADVRAAEALRLPQLELSAGYTRQSDVPELTLTFPGQPPRTLFPNIPDNFRSRAQASLPLYTGGRLGALGEAAHREREASEADRRAAASDLVLETTSAYWSLVTARAGLHVIDEALHAYDAHLEDARNRERMGLAARNEVLAVEVERDRADLARLRASHAAAVAEADLVRLLGLEPGPPVEAVDALADAASAADVDLDGLVKEALARRPERAALAAHVAAAEARTRAEGAGRLPQAALAAGFDYANPNRRILPPEAAWNDSWDVSINVAWTPFDGGRTRAAADRARARAEALRLQLADVDRRVRLQVTQRALDLAAARQAAAVTLHAQDAARENSRVAGERHHAGVSPSSERLDAEVGALRAALEHEEALARVRISAAALDRAVGR